MPYDDVTLTREKLYEDVWTRPVTQLAKEIGISNVALHRVEVRGVELLQEWYAR